MTFDDILYISAAISVLTLTAMPTLRVVRELGCTHDVTCL